MTISADYVAALRRLCQPISVRDYLETLQPMRDLMAALGDLHQALNTVVVTGSTGKGTACYTLAQRLQASGLRVGLYTSPHLHSFRERFMIDGQRIDMQSFTTGARIVAQAADPLEHLYSTFERATALALWWFGQQQPDIVVLEVGLGGRWDAVNVVDNVLAVFTPIEAEHVAMLGGSLQSIAEIKAGIIQPGGHAISVPQSAIVDDVLRRECALKTAQMTVVAPDALARSVCENLQSRGILTASKLVDNRTFYHLPGRLERIEIGEHTILIDGGHTPLAAQYLLDEINRIAGESGPIRLIVGLLSDKNARAYLQVFDLPRFHITLTQAPGHRGAAPEAIAAQAALKRAMVAIVPNLNTALAQATQAPETLVVVAGSLRMAAAAREQYGLLRADELAEARATRAIFEGEEYLGKLSTSSSKASETRD